MRGEARMGGKRGPAGSTGEVAGGEGQYQKGMHENVIVKSIVYILILKTNQKISINKMKGKHASV